MPFENVRDSGGKTCPNQEIWFPRCIIHREVLCKTGFNMNHVTSTAVKVVNLIRARGSNHRQFTSLLQDTDAEHTDAPYNSNIRWLSLITQ
jgi:hypothetical protein